MAKIAYVSNAPSKSGIGLRATEIVQRLASQADLMLDHFRLDAPHGQLVKNESSMAHRHPFPGPFKAKPIQWVRLARKLPPQKEYDLWHFASQALSFIPRRPFILTVHDLVELIEPQEPLGGLAARYLYRGIPRASHLICVSEFTKDTVQKRYRIPDERMTVIPNGVSSKFAPIPQVKQTDLYEKFISKHDLSPDNKIILYVGSDHPRKNLETLVEVFAKVNQKFPDARLIKIGTPGIESGRTKFLQRLNHHNLTTKTRIINKISDEELLLVYSFADVLVFPSKFEGFGLPALEAMASGCPVISSNKTSLPEVVGNAGMLCEPTDIECFTNGVSKIFLDTSHANQLSEQGIEQAKKFTWENAAASTFHLYQKILNS